MKKICYVVTISRTIKSFFIPQLKYLAENGYEVTVICSPDDDIKNVLGNDINYIPVYIARGVEAKSLLGTINKLTDIFKTEKFDIVQYSTPNAAFCAAIAAKRAGIKIRNYHLMGLRYLGMSGAARTVFKLIEKYTCRLSTHIECITPSNLELALNAGLFPREKAVIVWNGSTGGVDMSRFDCSRRSQWRQEIRNEQNIGENEFVFGFVGRITRDKGINEILTAFGGLSGRAGLLLVGPDEGVDTLDKELWENALADKRIVMHDTVTDIERYYAAMDVLLLPSYREGFGMSIAEAAAVGTPAIVSDIPGPVDVIDKDKTAFIVKVKDAESLRERMQFFLDDPNRAYEMSEDCVEHIRQKFDGKRLCEKILERKEQLLSSQ